MALSRGQLTRQKMINLMYLVFIAMLALNISTEVLDGFVLINDNLQESIEVTSERNKQIYSDIQVTYDANPGKAGTWYNEAQRVKLQTDSLFDYIQTLKTDIAKKTDGADADINDLKGKDNIDAATEVMISVGGRGEGQKLKRRLDDYRESVITLISDESKKEIVRATLSTEPSERARKANKSWEQASFDRMPSIAALTLLTEIQVNVKQAEGEVLNNLVQNIDLKDLRVNELTAFVVPQSSMVMKGTSYKADIILAAVDTTQRPLIVVNGKELPAEKNGFFEIGTGTPGTYPLKGFIELTGRNNEKIRRDFSTEYTVMEPMATVAPLLMDVVYAGIDNRISISVPGVATKDVQATVVDGGTLTQSGNLWVAKPAPAKIGQKFVIAVSARINGVMQLITRSEFRIRSLPEPLPFIQYKDANGADKIFRKGNLARSILLNTPGIKASIDDGILNIPFTVLSFTTVSVDAMNNSTSEVSDGANFSSRQIEQMRRMTRGSTFYISRIKARGPDGIDRDLYTMDVRIN